MIMSMGRVTMSFYNIDGLKSIGTVYFLVDPVVGTKPNLSFGKCSFLGFLALSNPKILEAFVVAL